MKKERKSKSTNSSYLATNECFLRRVSWINTKRSLDQDIIRGILIILIMAYHILKLSGTAADIVTSLCTPIMAFFFLVPGFNHNYNRPIKKEDYWPLVFRRFKQLIVTTFICSTICFIALLIYGYCAKVDGFNFSSWTVTYLESWLTRSFLRKYSISYVSFVLNCFVVNWFVIALFISYMIFYLVVDFAIKDARRLFPTIILLGTITTVLCVWQVQILPFCIGTAPLFAAIMLLGAGLKKYKFLNFQNKKTWQIAAICAGSCLLLVFLIHLSNTFGMLQNGELGSDPASGTLEPAFTLIFAYIIAYAYMSIGFFLNKLRFMRIFAFFSQNAIYYLGFHLTLYRFFNIVFNIPGYDPEHPYTSDVTLRSLAILAIVIAINTAIIIVINITKQYIKERKDANRLPVAASK